MLCSVFITGHAPWGQWNVYRQEHLLILSTREDIPSYPFSKILVSVLNQKLPESSARPARARTFDRVQSLFSTGQIPLLVLSKKNAVDLTSGMGVFSKYNPIPARIICMFDDLVLISVADFPPKFAWLVTNAIINSKDIIQDANLNLEEDFPIPIHLGSEAYILGKPIPE